MNTYKKLIYLSIVILLLTGCKQNFNEVPTPEAYEGFIDLSSWNLDENGVINLKGTWEFYWQHLFSPKELLTTNEEASYIQVPSAWNGYNLKHKQLSGEGYATYRLVINTNLKNQYLGLELPKLSTSYNLWINHQPILSSGKVSLEADIAIPKSQPSTVYFDSEEGITEIVIQVSNFHHFTGGILENIKLGTQKQIKLRESWYLAFDIFVFGSLFVSGIYHLIFFFWRRKEKSNLYFGLFCVMIGLRTLFVGKMFIFHLFPDFNWELALKVEYLTFYLGTPLFILYLKSILFKEISIKLIYISITISLIFSTIVLLNPVRFYAKYNIFYQAYSIIVIIYLLYALILASLRKREGAYAVGLAVVFFVATIINDILYESSIIYYGENIVTTNLSSWGFLVFIFSQSIILSRKFTYAYFKIEDMSLHLKQLNENLEEMVLERTIALESTNRKLERAYKELSKMEKSRTNLLTNISHDLRSPMASILGYINAILDGIVDNPEQLKKYLQRIKEKISGLNYLTQELFDLIQLESRQIKLTKKVISLDTLMIKAYEKYIIDVQNSGISFIYLSEDKGNKAKDILLDVDFNQIDRVFANVIYNAIKFTPQGGKIILDYYVIKEENYDKVIIKIVDNGIGISKEDLPNVFNRFHTGSKSRTSGEGSGLGLSITKEIIEYHNGQVWITSVPGETTVYISFNIV